LIFWMLLSRILSVTDALPIQGLQLEVNMDAQLHLLTTIATLCRFISEPLEMIPESRDEQEEEDDKDDPHIFHSISEDAAVTAAAASAAHASSSSKGLVSASIARGLISDDNFEWNAFAFRKAFALKLLETVLSSCRKAIVYPNPVCGPDGFPAAEISGWATVTAVNPVLAVFLRKSILPILLDYLSWSLSHRVLRESAFREGLDFFSSLCTSPYLSRVLSKELAIVWDMFLLGILSDTLRIDNNLKPVFRAVLIDITEEELKELMERAVIQVKLEILEVMSKLLSKPRLHIDTFFN